MNSLFSSALELGEFVVASDLLHCSWEAIDELQKNPRSSEASSPLSPFTVKYETSQKPKYKILAFACSSSPSSAIQQQEEKQGNPYLSIIIAARALYRSLPDDLFEQLGNSSGPLNVTGYTLGGLVASFVTLEILQRFSSSINNLPLCITFGSPIVRSTGLRQVIYDQPIWNSQFLHVVSVQDHIPLLLIPSNSPSTVSNPSASHSKGYKPFGTYIMCSTSGCACFNSPDSVLQLLEARGRSQLVNPNVKYDNILGYLEEFNGLRHKEYGHVLGGLKKSIFFSGVFSSLLPGLSDLSAIEVGIRLQVEAIEVRAIQEKQAKEDMRRHNEHPETELNQMKKKMAYLEWFKMSSWTTGEGYYDHYKCRSSTRSLAMVDLKNALTEYWKNVVEEAKRKGRSSGDSHPIGPIPPPAFYREDSPSEEEFRRWKRVCTHRGVPLQIRYLYAGINYRRMVEPLDIADFYKIPGQKNYLKHRPKHYKLLQKWEEEDDERAEKNRGAVTLTEDSCFWAHVEDAMILTDLLNNKKEAENCGSQESVIKEDLKEFESYVMGLIENFKVSPEIFLEKSTFMRWWTEYNKILEDGRSSPLIDYMKAKMYQNYNL